MIIEVLVEIVEDHRLADGEARVADSGDELEIRVFFEEPLPLESGVFLEGELVLGVGPVLAEEFAVDQVHVLLVVEYHFRVLRVSGLGVYPVHDDQLVLFAEVAVLAEDGVDAYVRQHVRPLNQLWHQKRLFSMECYTSSSKKREIIDLLYEDLLKQKQRFFLRQKSIFSLQPT